MPDDFVQVPPDSTGKKVDNSTVTTGAGVVERQRVSIGDAVNANNAQVSEAGALKVLSPYELEMLFELRKISLALSLLCLDHGILLEEGVLP